MCIRDRIYSLGMPAMAIYNFGNGVLSAIGDTKRPLIYLSIAGVVNVLLNLFFVIVCHMAAAGVATASAISLYILSLIHISLSFGALNLAYAAETENASSDKKTERYGQLLSYV